LARAVIASIHIYTMQIFWLPRAVCEGIDKIVRDFIWGRSDGERGLNLVNWNTISRLRQFGGLGLRDARLVNISLLWENAWQLFNGRKKIWVRLMHHKYLGNKNLFQASASPIRGGQYLKLFIVFERASCTPRSLPICG
jgi:hypothetical protein